MHSVDESIEIPLHHVEMAMKRHTFSLLTQTMWTETGERAPFCSRRCLPKCSAASASHMLSVVSHHSLSPWQNEMSRSLENQLLFVGWKTHFFSQSLNRASQTGLALTKLALEGLSQGAGVTKMGSPAVPSCHRCPASGESFLCHVPAHDTRSDAAGQLAALQARCWTWSRVVDGQKWDFPYFPRYSMVSR